SEGECAPCTEAAAVQQLGFIGDFAVDNERWWNQAKEKKISGLEYAELLMREAVKQARADDIEVIDEVILILKGQS
ncbi:MAG: hypothetical protein ACRD3M_01040, partial [Thermoanaerobaculia bacterium]